MVKSREQINKELFILAKEGDKDAEELLYKNNINFIHHLAIKYKNLGFSDDDIMSISNIGYMKAFKTFDISKGFHLITYFSRCMENEILMEARKSRKDKSLLSIHEPRFNEEGDEITLEDTLILDSNTLEEDDIVVLHEIISIYLKFETDKRYIAVFNSIFIDDEPQAAVARKLGISQSYVSRIHKKIVSKIRQLSVENEFLIRSPIKRDRFANKSVMMGMLSGEERSKISYLVMNYDLNIDDIAAIVGSDKRATSFYIYQLNSGFYSRTETDSSIEPEANKYLQEKYPERTASIVSIL